MTISKLGRTLAFCLALSAGQAHAEPWTVAAENRSLWTITSVEFAQGAFTGTKQNSDIIYPNEIGNVKFDKPSGVCLFNIKVNYVGTRKSYNFKNVNVCRTKVSIFSNGSADRALEGGEVITFTVTN